MSGTAAGAGGGASNVLREFLVKLGYSEDEGSRRKFTDALKVMTLTVASLGAAVAAAAVGVVSGVRQMANSANELYFISQRTKASAQDIRAMEEAFTNLGGTAGQARAALEKVTEFIQTQHGQQYLESITGKPWRDAASGMEELAEAFQKERASGMDMSTILQQAAVAGLSYADVNVLLQHNFAETAAAYREMSNKILGDAQRQQVISDNARKFTNSYNELEASINLFATNFGDMLGTKLKPLIDDMREYLLHHSEQINAFMETASKVIVHVIGEMLEFGKGVGEILGKMYEWYQKLTPEGKETAKAIEAVGFAIVAMNTAIGRSPLVRIAAFGIALYELYKNYMAWKNDPSTEQFINWDRWGPGMEAAIHAVETVFGWIEKATTAVGGWQNALELLLLFMVGKWTIGMVAAATTAVTGMNLAFAPLLLRLAPLMALLAFVGPAGSSTTFEEQEEFDRNYRESTRGGSVLGNKLRRILPKALGGVGKEGLVNPIASEDMTDIQRNFLDTLARPESQGDYRVKNGGTEFDSFKQFPDYVGQGGTSTASGRYQFTRDTWAEMAGILGLRDFSPESQDKAAWFLAQREYATNSGGRDLANDWQDPRRRQQIAAGLYGRWPSTNKWMNTPIVPLAPKVEYDQQGRPLSPTTPQVTPAPAGETPVQPITGGPNTASLLYTPPAVLPGAGAAGAGGSANDNSTTVHQTNHVHLSDVGGHDPNHVAALIGNAIGQHTQYALAQSLRNGKANVV